ncbi:MAG: 50S ribosomal protein L32 [Vampirovibrionales bacterium]|nr:50S ribosomal protein L32 [Vampirovibrionales bacterium]
MPVPKKRQGHSDQGHRRACWKAVIPEISKCPNCGAVRHPHTMCGACGFYRDRIVRDLAVAEETFELDDNE